MFKRKSSPMISRNIVYRVESYTICIPVNYILIQDINYNISIL